MATAGPVWRSSDCCAPASSADRLPLRSCRRAALQPSKAIKPDEMQQIFQLLPRAHLALAVHPIGKRDRDLDDALAARLDQELEADLIAKRIQNVAHAPPCLAAQAKK